MPPKSIKGKKSNPSGEGDGIIGARKKMVGIQAIVLLDSSTPSCNFAPLTTSTLPIFLLPVCGTPLLEYTLEFLAMQSIVHEIVLVTTKPTSIQALRHYLISSRWNTNLEDFTTLSSSNDTALDALNLARPRIKIPILSPACKSSGDEIRALEGTGVLKSGATFLLLEGLLVSNANLTAAIAAHEIRAKADPNVTLTSVLVRRRHLYQQQQPSLTSSSKTTTKTTTTLMETEIPYSRLTDALDRVLVSSGQSLCEISSPTLDPIDGRIWSYAITPGLIHSDSISTLPVQRPEGASKDVASRLTQSMFLDVAETGLYICSPQVAIHFSDNYDYASLKRHYIKNEVSNIAMGWRFNVHILDSAYALQASLDPRSFQRVNLDVANGWCFPITVNSAASWSRSISTSISSISSSVTASSQLPFIARNNMPFASIHPTAQVDPTAKLGSGVVIGPNCIISANVVLDKTILGTGVCIDPNARILNSILFSSIKVESNALIIGSIIGNEVIIKSFATVQSGCILGENVLIGNNHTVPLASRITLTQKPSSVFKSNDILIVGTGGEGRAWPCTKNEGNEEENDDDTKEEDIGNDDENENDEDKKSSSDTVGESGSIAAASALNFITKTVQIVKDRLYQGHKDIFLKELVRSIQSAYKFKNLFTAPGLQDTLELALCLVWGASPHDLQKSTGTSKTAHSSSSSTSTTSLLFTKDSPLVGHGANSSDPALHSFSFGVFDLFYDNGTPPLPHNASNLALEIKSFKYAENRTTADCLNEVVPLIFGLLKGVMTVSSLKTHVTIWATLLSRFVVEPDDEIACISSLAKYLCRPSLRTSLPTTASDPRLMFGLIVNFLFDNEIAAVEGLLDEEGNERGVLTAEGIRAWSSKAWQATNGDDEEEDIDDKQVTSRDMNKSSSSTLPDIHDLSVLLESKYWTLLQDRLDEEEEEEEEEEEIE